MPKDLTVSLNKNKYYAINSYEFAQKAKTLEIYQDEMQVLYDIANLYSSAPVDKVINVLIHTVNNNIKCPKLTLTDPHKLTKLCLSVFSYMNIIFTCFKTVELLDFHLW